MVRLFGTLRALATVPMALFAVVSCGQPHKQTDAPAQVRPISTASLDTVNLPQTSVKWQSIGNCWAYAALGWAESMILRGPESEEPNFSETYVTYRHYELQLRDRYISELQTGGSFQEAANISIRFGLMKEGDFAPDEAKMPKSLRQKMATDYLNQSLKSGPLSKLRDAKTIRSELDTAFGVDLASLQDKIIPASSLYVPVGRGATAPLDEVMISWREVQWPIDYANYPSDGISEPTSKWNGKVTEEQARLMRRVMRAMNAKYPVVINWFVDFRAMNNEGIFDLATLRQYVGNGRQGYHSTVLEDYIAEGVDPRTNLSFVTPEGEVSDELKSLAVQYGSVKALIVKNSWGGSERLDRPSYFRDGEKGYHKLGVDYLLAFLPQFDEESARFQGYTTGLNSFILPPGF